MKRVLILGATSEVALALADVLAEQSCELILAARNVNRLEPVKSDLAIRFNASVTLAEFDALHCAMHPQFFKQLVPMPDTVICFLGYMGEHTKALADWDECYKILSTNYTGAISILNIFANEFEAKRQGTIVGISSVAGERGRQSNYLYGSSKAGFTAYLSGLRNRLFKSNVHVLTVKPGFMQTRMLEGMKTPKFLTAQPREAAILIKRAIDKKKNTAYVFPIWKWVMLVIKSIPEPVFKRLKL
ncbi:MAG: SDR family oxidoreductase [Cyclobacteriaceae bacterium]|nr:SDR family oxidoreductase [Cyclobacteriaceae bacterium]